MSGDRKMELSLSGRDKFPSTTEKVINRGNGKFCGTVFHRELIIDAHLKLKYDHKLTVKKKQLDRQLVNYLRKIGDDLELQQRSVGDEDKGPSWKLTLEMGVTQEENQQKQEDQSTSDDEELSEDDQAEVRKLKGYIKLKGRLLTALRALSAREAKVEVGFHCDSRSSNDDQTENISTKEMSICKGRLQEFCQDWSVEFPVNDDFDCNYWKRDAFSLWYHITIEVPMGTFTGNYKQVRTNALNRKILEEGTLSDVTIVAKNGARIKAHKCFLAAHSAPLVAKIQKRSQGVNGNDGENVLVLTELTEEGVHALLKFCYYKDKHPLRTNTSILKELLLVSYKYKIYSLSCSIQGVLLTLPKEKRETLGEFGNIAFRILESIGIEI